MTAPLPSSVTSLVARGPGSAGRLAATVAVVGLSAATLTGMATGAFFTDTASVDANTFTTGTVEISTTPTTAVVSFSTMAPGDRVTAPLVVRNDGTLALRYSFLSTTTEDLLAAQLDLTVKTGVTTCDNTGFSSSGTVLYGAADLGSTGGTKVLGDAAPGQSTGDRTLDASTSEILCLSVALPSATGNAYQGQTTTATFRFDAEQTANN